ncbi:type II secretion system minor pseudopilin GspK [Inhella sp.]|uniref:type II secretion system minor pseudopilin GspK n=1 Tax=Inhella sp. TaxID=1921806 RepID=UPI0035B160CE
MRTRQRGAALLTALLIVSLVATLAAAMVWRQLRAVHLEAADRARAQAHWVLLGALDWARLILREDQRANTSEPVDHLGEVWAVPLAEARLSTFLAADKQNAKEDEGPEAFLSGRIDDAQARYNLRNLIDSSKDIPALEKRTVGRLFQSAGLPADMAEQFVQQLNRALQASDDSADAPMRPQTVAQLAWLGLPPDAVRALEPWVVILPQPSPVNVNTAPREVLAALFDNMDLATAERLVQQRRTQPFRNVAEIQRVLGRAAEGGVDAKRIDVKSDHFLVTGRLRLDDRVVEQRSLVQRTNDSEVKLLWRERVSPPPGTSTQTGALGAP